MAWTLTMPPHTTYNIHMDKQSHTPESYYLSDTCTRTQMGSVETHNHTPFPSEVRKHNSCWYCLSANIIQWVEWFSCKHQGTVLKEVTGINSVWKLWGQKKSESNVVSIKISESTEETKTRELADISEVTLKRMGYCRGDWCVHKQKKYEQILSKMNLLAVCQDTDVAICWSW